MLQLSLHVKGPSVKCNSFNALVALLFAAIGAFGPARTGEAQCYTVQNATTFIVDGGTFGAAGLAAGDCLGQAIRDIPNGGTIRLRIGTGPFFIVRAPMSGTPESDERTGLPFVDKAITIEGFNGAGSPLDAIISADTTDGNVPDYRLFLVRGDTGELTLNRVTLQNGRSLTPGQTNGGAIKHDSLNPLRLNDCIVRDNLAGTRGGGIWSQQVVLCTNVRFIRNHANPAGLPGNPGESIRGGAIYHAPGKSFPETDIILSLSGCIFRCNSSTEEGGAIWLGGGYQRRINNCQFYGNAAVQAGGAMTCNGTSFSNTVPPVRLEVTNCVFGRADVANFACANEPASPPNFGDAYGAGNTAGADGGAVQLVDNAQPVFVRCTFENNRVTSASNGRGGAVYMSSIGGNNPSLPRSAVFIESLFLRNQSFTGGAGGGDGGGVFIRESSSPYFIDCGFIENNAMRGGGMHVIGGSNPRLYNCVLSRNAVGGAGAQGSALWTAASSPQLLHCSLLTAIGSPLVWMDSGSATPLRITNSVVWDGGVHRAFGGSGLVSGNPAASYPQIAYSDIDVSNAAHFGDPTSEAPNPAGSTNINCDPLVADAAINDVHLTTCSPAIDRASHALAATRYNALFAAPFATFGFSFAIVGLTEGEHRDFDYDDPGAPPEGAFHNNGTGPRARTPRLPAANGPVACEADMGADESPFFIWATMTVSCKKRSTTSGTCASPVFLTDPANCSYCVGDNVVIEPEISGSCPTEFRVTQWRRLSTGAPCPPVNLSDPLPGTPVVEGGRFSIDPVTGRLCITGVQASDAGCYYAVLERQGCAGTNRAAFKNGDNIALPCVDRIAACACISVNSPPTISAQPPNRTLCEGDPTTISVTAAAPPGRVLCYQWFRRATPCDGSCPTPGSGGTRIQDLPANIRNGISGECTATLSFLPLRPEHEGYYYVRVVAWDPASGACPCPIDNGAVFDCAEVTSCCGFVDVVCKPTANVAPTSANVCVGGTQSFTATFTQCAGQDLPLVVQWFRRTFNGPSCSGQQTGEVPVGAPINLPANNNDSHTLVIPNAGLASEGCYFVRVSVQGFAGCSNDSPCRCLTVLPPPTVSPPNDRVVCENGTQTISAIVTYSGNPANLCYQWYQRTDPCVGTPTPADGTPVTNGGGISGANTPTLTFNPAVPAHAGYYFLCVRVCTLGGSAVNDAKCPAVCSPCARLDVRPPPVACQIECPGTPAGDDCLICTGANATLQCGATQDPELCYQWQKRSPAGVWEDIPGQNGFRLVITAYNDAQHRGCYRVRVNYAAFAQGGNCPEQTDKCNAAYSNVICLAQDPNCCSDDCECKENENEPDIRYALWRTGEWDGVNGEPSYEGAQEGTPLRRLIKSADDVYLDPYCMHRIAVFNGYMLVKAANPALPLNARLHIYRDCNGEPGELIHTLDPDCVQVRGPVLGQPEFRRVQFQFTPECLWLRGGIYWFSLVGVGPLDDTSYEAYWATAGFPGNPSFPPPPDTPDGFLLGKRPVFMDEFGPWQEFDPCCHPCDDFEFCITGESCPIIWDNGRPDFGGADGPNPPPSPIVVPGTRSERSNLPPRDSRAADQFVVKTCDSEEICYIEGYMLTNCTGFTAHLEIYENDCDEPYFRIPVTNSPYYHRTATVIEDLGLEGLRVGTTNVRAYRVSFCDWPIPLVLQPGRNYWLSLSIQDSFSANERAFFAHVLPPCDPCTGGNVYRINPGMEIAPGRQIPDWRSAGADFAFLIAARKRAGEPASSAGTAPPCPADLNQNNAADVEDIFLFLSAFFAGCP